MTAKRFDLEDFSPFAPRPSGPLFQDLSAPDPVLDQTALASFDKGYSAGWDDATSAANSESERLDSALVNNLEDLGFTYHEARAHVMRSLTPLLTGVLTKLLPRLIRDSLGARIMEEIDGLAENAADTPIDLMVCPGDAGHMKDAVARITSLPLRLIEDPTLPTGQIFLRIGHVEREIDLTGAISSISEAFSALDDLNKETVNYA